MSVLGHQISTRFVSVAALLLVLAALVPATSEPQAREITLVAKGMAFYLVDDPSAPNPPLRVKPGERVRIVLRNEDRGMQHDFAVPSADAATPLLNWNRRAVVTFEAPATPGRYDYVCQPHQLMMRGSLQVVP